MLADLIRHIFIEKVAQPPNKNINDTGKRGAVLVKHGDDSS